MGRRVIHKKIGQEDGCETQKHPGCRLQFQQYISPHALLRLIIYLNPVLSPAIPKYNEEEGCVSALFVYQSYEMK